MRSSFLLVCLLSFGALAHARISTVQELNYLRETLGSIAAAGGFTLDEDSLSVHGFSTQEDRRFGLKWWNTPAGDQDHTILFRLRKSNDARMRKVFFMSKESHVGRPCRLHNQTSRRMVSAFDGRENCVTLYLRRNHLKSDPDAQTLRAPNTLLWGAFGSKRP